MSNQGGPEAPLRFQMAPKFKGALFLQQGSRWPWCLVSYYPMGPKRRNPDMYVWVRLKPYSDLKPEWPPRSKRYSDILFISLKSPVKRTPSRFPKRAPIEREAHLQGILHISEKPSSFGFPGKGAFPEAPSTEPLERVMPPSPEPLHPTLKIPGRRVLLQVPQKQSPYEKRCPSPEPFLNILQGSRRGSPPSRFLSQSSHGERQSIFRAPIKRDSRPQNLPLVTFRAPTKEHPPSMFP